MEEDFIIRTHREGTVDTTPGIETTMNTMACTGINARTLGKVTIIVERENGVNTKEKINWGSENDSQFNALMQQDAQVLLGQARKVVEGGGNDGDLRLKVVTKK